MIEKDGRCPFCGSVLINVNRCNSCHAFQIKGYVSREARVKINLISTCASLLAALFGTLITFLSSHSIGACIPMFFAFFCFFISIKKILFIKEVKKGKVVWKRPMITW